MSVALLFQIPNWATEFEVNRTRELKELSWVPVRNKLDSDGYTELVDHPNGAAHLGAWMAILAVASRCDPRGTLIRQTKTPHDAHSLARVSRLPVCVFEEVIPRLIEIGWLEAISFRPEALSGPPQEGAARPQEGAARPQGAAPSRARASMEGNGKKEKKGHTRGARAVESSSPTEAGGVSVSNDLTEDDYYNYARAQRSLHAPDAWAAIHWEKRDRDKVVRDWKHASVAQAHSAPLEKMSYGDALGHVIAVGKAGHPDLHAVIKKMCADGRIDDEMAYRLVSEIALK